MTTLYMEHATSIAATRKGGAWTVVATCVADRRQRQLGVHNYTGKGASSDFDTALRYALLDLNGKVRS